ncbi:hypothetical protein C8R43DRAFT_963519 [Mycena crocata]|nr:hypothetical protein C8R43DRAFT_963519 [Mycena crocata]
MQKRKGFQHCNTFVADFITAHTTEIRTSRQVASRLQYLGSATRDPRSDSWFDLSFGTAIVDIPLVIELIRHRRILDPKVKPFVTNRKVPDTKRVRNLVALKVFQNGLEFALSYPPEAGDTSRTIAPNLDEEACPLVRQRGTSSLETDVNGMCGKFAYLASPNYNSSVTNTSSLVQWDKLLDGPTGTSHFGALPFVGLPAVIPSGHLKESEQSFSFPLSMQYEMWLV